MLRYARILVAEDNALIAMDLADGLVAAGARLLGPFARVAGALQALEGSSIDAAILDANLADRDVTPLATALLARGIPFIIYSGTGLPEAMRRWAPAITVVSKPASIASLIERLARLIAMRATADAAPRLVATAA